MPRRSALAFVAWTSRRGRPEELVEALGGGVAMHIYPAALSRRSLFLLRYIWSAGATLVRLGKARPAIVVVTAPPIFAPLAAWLYCALTRTPLVLDSHPTAFGAKGHRPSQLLQPLHRFLAQRARFVMVTSKSWVELVKKWGGAAEIVHEAPPVVRVNSSEVPGVDTFDVLFVGIFGGDEPVDVVLEAARNCADLRFAITGDLLRCPQHLREAAPDNVTFTGYLQGNEYWATLQKARMVLALTTEATSAMRAAYEAVYLQSPLLVSDTELLRELFPFAAFTPNDAPAMVKAIRELLAKGDGQQEQRSEALDLQQARWQDQVRAISHRLPELSYPSSS